MRKLPAFAIAGVAAAALAGTAYAAAPQSHARTHVINVPLPDGSVARVEYAGNVAPKVTLADRPFTDSAMPWAMPFPSLADFDRMIDEMNRRSEEMMRQAQQIGGNPAGAAPYIASYGNLPAGGTSTTVVSVSNGSATCTRTTEVVSEGSGKPPKVTSSVSGQCASGPAAAPPSGPASRA